MFVPGAAAPGELSTSAWSNRCAIHASVVHGLSVSNVYVTACISYNNFFTVRRSALHGLCDSNSVRLSFCPPVCLSHSLTVSTRFDLRS